MLELFKDLRVYPRFRVVSFNPLVIERDGVSERHDGLEARVLLAVSLMPGATLDKLLWSIVAVESIEEDADPEKAVRDALATIMNLAEKGLLLVVE